MNIYFDPTDHTYTSEYGKEYTPVTKICGITPRAVNFKALPYQDRIQKAASRGTVLHAELQNFVDSGDIGLFPTTEWFAKNVHPNFKNWESEVVIYSDEDEDKESYAGQIDLICQDDNGHYHLWDFKTGGHETVDYQLSLYKRGFCKNRTIDPEIVQLHCIDAKNEDKIKVLDIRTIAKEWLDALLCCYSAGEPYREPAVELKGMPVTALEKLEAIESYYLSLKAELDELDNQKKALESDLYKAMEEFGRETFDFGSIHATRVKPTTADTFDSKSFSKDHPELYKAYIKSTSRKGYLKMTVRDLTEAV